MSDSSFRAGRGFPAHPVSEHLSVLLPAAGALVDGGPGSCELAAKPLMDVMILMGIRQSIEAHEFGQDLNFLASCEYLSLH
jgi:hypothetical protein